MEVLFDVCLVTESVNTMVCCNIWGSHSDVLKISVMWDFVLFYWGCSCGIAWLCAAVLHIVGNYNPSISITFHKASVVSDMI